MKTPVDLYTPSARRYNGLPEIDYPFHDRDALVTNCRRICIVSVRRMHFLRLRDAI
ncbi:hypothetical protein LPB79_15795 [Rhizobium sp. T136]|nr:hypothetical protein [Rhizobium sp. T136]UFS83661.1 hypothetical protein LPB79_15795 [Rhizobium sp. T136]